MAQTVNALRRINPVAIQGKADITRPDCLPEGSSAHCPPPFHNLSLGETEFSRHISALSSPNHVSKKRAKATE
jgi:hypothetical protein